MTGAEYASEAECGQVIQGCTAAITASAPLALAAAKGMLTYKQDVIGGAENAATTLFVTQTACFTTAAAIGTALTGGAAAGALGAQTVVTLPASGPPVSRPQSAA